VQWRQRYPVGSLPAPAERSAKRLATISRVERLRFTEGDEEAA
jgi:hypothetical protein